MRKTAVARLAALAPGMKLAFLALALVLAAPANAHAAAPGVMTRELALGGERSRAATATRRPFTVVGIHWRGTGAVSFRTRSVSGRWSAWRPAAPEAEDAPDPLSRERSRRGWRIGNPYWTGRSNRIQVRARGAVRRVRAFLLREAGAPAPPRALTTAVSPPIITRLAWSADESLRREPPEYAAAARYVVVHHTAGSNNYTRAQAAGIVRGIQRYHVVGNGWNDIGYNFLVDKYGQVFEGRFGGMERPVVGAHAEGFNTGSVGIAVVGSYGSTGLTAAAQAALVRLIAWRLDVAHVDPLSAVTAISGGNARYGKGLGVLLRAVVGHRDTGFTSCPGGVLYGQLGALARAVSTTGLPKLYNPAVTGTPGSRVRFTARLSGALPWSVVVSDPAGKQVAGGTGTGTTVDWTWDATGAEVATYRWAIFASADMRGVTGTLRARKGAVLTLTGVRASPLAFTPNGDGRDDTTKISYQLGAPARVVAKLYDPAGHQLATLLDADKRAGKHTFTFSAANVPDGAYDIVITATSATGRQAQSGVSVLVSRTLAAYTPERTAFSPNGDGELDTLSLRFSLATPAEVTLRIVRGRAWVATPFTGPLGPGPHTLTWDGKRSAGPIRDGRYDAELQVTDAVGSVTQRVAFTSDTTAPRLGLVSVHPLRIRVSEPAELVVAAGVSRRSVAARAAGVVRIVAFASAARLRVVARDAAGNRSAPLAISR